jgi:hypothetical protein
LNMVCNIAVSAEIMSLNEPMVVGIPQSIDECLNPLFFH